MPHGCEEEEGGLSFFFYLFILFIYMFMGGGGGGRREVAEPTEVRQEIVKLVDNKKRKKMGEKLSVQ